MCLKRALAIIKFYWVFPWFYNGSPLPLGLIGFLFVLFAELEVESKSKASLTLCNNTVLYFIEFATVLSQESFLVSEHFCLFFKYILSQYRPSLGHMENACTMQNLLLEGSWVVYPHVQDSSSIPKLDFMHTLVLEHFCVGVRCCLRIPETILQ